MLYLFWLYSQFNILVFFIPLEIFPERLLTDTQYTTAFWSVVDIIILTQYLDSKQHLD